MDYVRLIATYFGTLTFAAGSAAAIAVGLFRFFGEKWISARFEREKTALQAQRDANIRFVQRYLDQEIHRAKKLADREFDVLSEAWRLLVRSFNNAESTGFEFVHRLERLNERERQRLIEDSDLKQWQVEELMALEGEARDDYLRKCQGYKRLTSFTKDRREFDAFLLTNGIFMPGGMKERFEAIARMVSACFAQFQARLDTIGGESPYDSFEALKRLTKEGRPLLDALEGDIHGRLWSATTTTEHASRRD